MSAIELLPCPFCGGEATTEHDATVEENHAYGCRRCGLWFDTFNSDDAITAWNRRTDLSQAAVAAALETAKDALNKMPRREERLGGQRTQYIQLHEAVETIAALITDCDRDALAAHVAAEVAKARAEAMEACAVIADKHRARIAEHHPDVERPDQVAQGYGNAALNISTEIRAAIGATK